MPDDPVAVLPSRGAELVEVNRFGSSGIEIGVQKSSVTLFVQGITADVLRAITIQVRQRYLVVVHRLGRIYLNRFVIADTSEFRILYPKSDSISSAAARKRRIAASPLLR
jgi:hypothetical protein